MKYLSAVLVYWCTSVVVLVQCTSVVYWYFCSRKSWRSKMMNPINNDYYSYSSRTLSFPDAGFKRA